MGVLVLLGVAGRFAGRVMLEAVRPPYEIRETLRQLFELGCRSAPLIAASGFAVGIVLSMHTRASLARLGAEALITPGLSIALGRETGPRTAGLLL
jgi:phospholipid/cholesterol/gamma-HCH transport system permease protein